MPEEKKPDRAVVAVITFEELALALALPSSMCITRAQVRGLAPEIFLRIDDVNFPEVAGGKGGRIAGARLVLDVQGAFKELLYEGGE